MAIFILLFIFWEVFIRKKCFSIWILILFFYLFCYLAKYTQNDEKNEFQDLVIKKYTYYEKLLC